MGKIIFKYHFADTKTMGFPKKKKINKNSSFLVMHLEIFILF